jgi:TRAP-type C4-dicarboxylate transport system substrate-binding protein
LRHPIFNERLKRGVLEGALLPLETLKGSRTGELMKYVTPSWKIGSAYAFYVVLNKDTRDMLPFRHPENDDRVFQRICTNGGQ